MNNAGSFHRDLGHETERPQKPAALTQAFPTPRDAVPCIMNNFPIEKRKDEDEFNGEFRNKRTILEINHSLAESMKTDKPYQTRLAPLRQTRGAVMHRERKTQEQLYEIP